MHRSTNVNQRGFAPVLAIIIVVVVAGIAGAGYMVFKRKSDSNSLSTSSASQKAAQAEIANECKKVLDDEDFCKFSSNWTGAEAYAATLTNTDTAKKVTTMSMEQDGKGNYSMVTKEEGKVTMSYVLLNGDTYMKEASEDTWTKIPKTESTATPKNTLPTDNIKIDTKQDNVSEADKTIYKKIGKESCSDNRTCLKYQIIDPSQPKAESFIWFDTKDYQLRKWSFAESDGSKSVGEFSFKTVTITAPSPVKELDLGTSAADMQKMIDDMQQQMANE